jgi:hypothetical protein
MSLKINYEFILEFGIVTNKTDAIDSQEKIIYSNN